jgi:hypothetical protein
MSGFARAGALLLALAVLGAPSNSAFAWVPGTLPATGSPVDGTDHLWNLSSLPNGAIPFALNATQPAGAAPVAPAGTTADGIASAVLAAFQEWQSVPTSVVKFAYQGQTGATNGFDGKNVVTLAPQGISFPPGGARSATVVTAAMAPGPVALPGGGTITASFAGQILDADIVINPTGDYSVSPLLPQDPVEDLQGIVAHEVGHLIGLDHTGIQGAAMYGFFTEGGAYFNRVLSQDEMIGASSLYPSGSFLTGTGAIGGMVVRQDGTQVFGAHIDAIDTATNSIVTSAITGLIATRPDGMPQQFASNSGAFLLTGLPQGSYRLSVEPLDGPGSPFLGGVFGDAAGDNFFPLDYLPVIQSTPVAVTPGQTVTIPAITVAENSMASPNLDAFAFAASAAEFLAPPMVSPGLPATLSVGQGVNIVANGQLVSGVSFGIDDPTIQITAPPLVRSTDILLQLSPSPTTAPGPKLVTLSSPSGPSIFSGGVIVIPGTATAAAILPSSRSVTIGTSATAFATIVNGGGTAATQCTIAPATQVPASFGFQPTNAATNLPIGTPNEPVDIAPNAAQSFVLSLTPSAGFAPTDVAFTFGCANAVAPKIDGLNTLLLSGSATPVPDLIALAATPSGDGILDLPGAAGANAFSVATDNLGAAGELTITADTGVAIAPVVIAVCPTDPTSGACLAPPAATVPLNVAANAQPTFSIFVTATGPVTFAPGINRIFVSFADTAGTIRGSTSVAVRTQ